MKIKTTLFLILGCCTVRAQIFNTVTNTSNAITTNNPLGTLYNGAAWIDYDNDGKLDLFAVKVGLFHNDGGGNFSKITNSGLPATGLGTTWADVDNDGDIDCFVTGDGNVGSKLYTNNGVGVFTIVNTLPFTIPTYISAFGACFGDYDNDGNIDLFMARPNGFLGITGENKLIKNNGSLSFIEVDTTITTNTGNNPYTNVVWSDFDLDNDVDLFVASGPASGTLGTDFVFQNYFSSIGSFFIDQTIPSPLSTELLDGQQWSFIDYDNDLDLDVYITNYLGTVASNGYPNTLFRNDNGSYVKMTGTDVGAIVTDAHTSLANIWQDFDNDGDLDCVVINDATEANDFYLNNARQGSSIFTKVTNEPFTVAATNQYFSGSAGDYDNDGDVDLYVLGKGTDCGLFENQTTQSAPNGDWINIKLEGLTANRSAIGAKVFAKAFGYWQMREITASNAFDGMNMLNVHFGFGAGATSPTIIDSLIIFWPYGQFGTVDICTNVPSNNFYVALQGQCLTPVGVNEILPQKSELLLEVSSNPFKNQLSVTANCRSIGKLKITLTDLQSRIIEAVFDGEATLGNNRFEIAGAKELGSGVYFIVSEYDGQRQSRKVVKE